MSLESHILRSGTSSIWHRGTQKRAIFAFKSTRELSKNFFFTIIIQFNNKSSKKIFLDV
jgi:hypothetical protein